MSLDDAKAYFLASPSKARAVSLLSTASRDFDDNVIDAKNYSKLVCLVRDWLNKPDQVLSLLQEASQILDEINNLPIDDEGTRELPAGSLDRAREISHQLWLLRKDEKQASELRGIGGKANNKIGNLPPPTKPGRKPLKGLAMLASLRDDTHR